MSEYDDLIDGFDEEEVVSHGMTVGDQSTADALDEILGSPPDPSLPLVQHMTTNEVPLDEPPHEPDDWPEPEPEVPLFADVDTVPPAELRALKPDQRPVIGQHYVIFGGIPRPVIRGNLTASEDEFVRENLFVNDDLRDIDGQRRVRADRTLRLRYRGYVCGEMSSL